MTSSENSNSPYGWSLSSNVILLAEAPGSRLAPLVAVLPRMPSALDTDARVILKYSDTSGKSSS